MTARPRRAPGGGLPEAEYYRAVEEHFLSLRGAPLTLSNLDWLLVRRWHAAGIPLRIVLRGISDALDAHAHSWGRRTPVARLGYCEAEVDSARQRWCRALRLESDERINAAGVLESYATALETAELPPAARPFALELAARMRTRAGEPGEGPDLDAWMAGCERDLVRALVDGGGGERVEALRAQVEAELVAWKDRLPPAVWTEIAQSALARRILEAHGLDRLSLVAL